MAEKVLVIGNGFDLDVNFRTRYSDFYKNWKSMNLWAFDESSTGLGGYINQCAKSEKWLDLEMALFNYANSKNGYVKNIANTSIVADRDDFEKLVYSLNRFIRRIIWEDKVNTNSVASKVLKSVLEDGHYTIYSFNYTNLGKIAARLYKGATLYDNVMCELKYTPIHGRVDDNDIILGVHSDAELVIGYEFLRKIDQPTFRSNNLLQDLEEAREVIFFGLSMGIIDYPYFREFFKKICNGVIPLNKKKHITIFTYNESSRMDVLKQLQILTNTDLLNLKHNSYFEIIRTESNGANDIDKLESWIARHNH